MGEARLVQVKVALRNTYVVLRMRYATPSANFDLERHVNMIKQNDCQEDCSWKELFNR